MLKFVYINKKKVPVPVPVMLVKDAIAWVEGVLLLKDHSITRIELDNKEIDYNLALEGSYGKIKLTDQSKLELQIDSPVDLSIQTLDALRNLSMIMTRSLRVLAVSSWQTEARATPPEIDVLTNDLTLILDLLAHLSILLKGLITTQHTEKMAVILEKVKFALQMANGNSDWQGFARILLKQLEPRLSELNETLNILQKDIFDYQTRKTNLCAKAVEK